jgi:hypothetical protein
MQKPNIYVLVAILILLINNQSVAQKIKLLKKTHLPGYPSASSLEIYKDKLYVIGDDAQSIFILNKEHVLLDSIHLFTSPTKRIDRELKTDLESSIILSQNGKDYLVAFSSFSTPNRNKIIFIELNNTHSQPRQIIDSIKETSLNEINIEGAASLNDQLVLSNRANTTHKYNSLIISSITSEGSIEPDTHEIITLLLPKTKMIAGISGLEYVKEKDILLFTASTENTPNAYTDGEIGSSYVGYVKHISKKLDKKSIKADKLIPISKYLTETSAQKIESITVEEIRGNKFIIHLAADNDNGESTLFKLRLNL